MIPDNWRTRIKTLHEPASWIFRFGVRGAAARFGVMRKARRDGFNASAYQKRYPDVGDIHPLIHFASIGQFEGRIIAAAPPLELHEGSLLVQALTFRAPEKPTGVSLGGESVDVITPFRNRRASVVQAVRSALEQTTDVTVYAIDDGSTDGGGDVLEETFAGEIAAERLIVLRQHKKGAAAARNAGLAVGKGDWVTYVDSDNVLDLDHVEKLRAAAREAGAAMAYGGWRTPTCAKHPAGVYDRRKLLTANFIDLNTLIHHRRLYEALGGFDERLLRLQDWDLLLRYGRVAAPVASSQVSVLRDIGADSISATVAVAPAFRQVRQNHICELIAGGLGPRVVYGSNTALDDDAEALRGVGLKVEFGAPANVAVRYRRGGPGALHVLTNNEASACDLGAAPYFRLIMGGDGPLSDACLNLAAADVGPAGWTFEPGMAGLATASSII